MKKILLDTNMLMSFGMLKVDVFSEIERICDFKYEIITLDSVIEELKGIQEKQSIKYKKAAKMALSIISRKLKVIESGIMPADDGILDLAKKDKDIIVATQDMELKAKLKALGIAIIALRQKKYLIMG